MAYTDYTDEFMDLILGGAGGAKENEAQQATATLKEWGDYIAEFITIVKDFFEQISELFK